ncbi:MAG: hypothetical protein J7501_06905 [Bdellovibrio sp.]|nr:hypothetical protein [Bdellovibrio sp.]
MTVSHTKYALILNIFFSVTLARAGTGDVTCYISADCGSGGGMSSNSGYSGNPSTGDSIKINPAVVPTQQGIGLESLIFKGTPDFALVKGWGRVGSAISPSNSEETFFGPLGVEDKDQLLERKLNQEKYPNQKFTFATAVNLFNSKGSGARASFSLGLLARYNKVTNHISPGGGVSGILGPIYFGYSIYDDETQLETSTEYPVNKPIRYQVQTYNVGLYLSSLLLDYSHLSQKEPHESNVNIFTASVMLKKFILTGSKRIEESTRPAFNFDTSSLEEKPTKEDYFGGVQYIAGKHFLVGAMYNYYLLHEVSGVVTFFF